jgi:hypothetical protein
LAAANLVDDLPDIDARELFTRAIHEAAAPARSEADELTQMYSHPLGAMRFGIGGNSRPAAVYLAARLARTEEQRRQVRQAALQLIGSDGDADFHVTQALRALGDDLESDVPWLARQGWALRSLAGIIWADSSSLPSSIGEALAVDSDARVRRTLADALARRDPTDRAAAARGRLASDPRFSVRRLVARTSCVRTDRSRSEDHQPPVA